MRATRAASEAELLANALHHLEGFRRYGITTLEANSGYGLDRNTELRLVRAVHAAGQRQPVRVVPTFLGAHVVPPEFKAAGPQAYVDFLLREVLSDLKGEAAFVDIFCEEGAFPPDVAQYFLAPAHKMDFGLKIHAEQLHDLGGCEMAAATLNAAWAIGQQHDCGSLEPGKRADLLVLHVPSVAEIPYWLGENPVRDIFIAGVE